MWALSSEYKIDQADFIDWMSNLMDEVRPKPSAQIPKAFHQHGIAKKRKTILV